MTFRIPAVTASQYVRLRGTNLPAALPFETDASGNPLPDVFTNATDRTTLQIPAPPSTAPTASSTAARTTWRLPPGRPTRSSASGRSRSTSPPGRTCGSTATRSTSRSGARRSSRGSSSAGRTPFVFEPLLNSTSARSPGRRRRVPAGGVSAGRLAARAAAAFRGPRRAAVRRRPPGRGRATTRTRSSSAPRWTARRGETFKARAATSPTRRSSRRCAASGSTTRCCTAKGWRCRSTRATRRSASA